MNVMPVNLLLDAELGFTQGTLNILDSDHLLTCIPSIDLYLCFKIKLSVSMPTFAENYVFQKFFVDWGEHNQKL